MNKSMRIMLLIMAIIFINVLLYHVIKYFYTKNKLENEANIPILVTATKVGYQEWQPIITAVPELIATDTVDVTTEVEGMIEQIFITSAQHVDEGDMLVQLRADDDIAAWQSLQASADLAKITYDLSQQQYDINVISKEDLDSAQYDMQMQQALADQQAAIVEKKSIRAPFKGRLGLFTYSPGQYFQPGDFIVSLQRVDPIYAYFYTPEKNVTHLEVGHKVTLTSDVYPKEVFNGEINAFDVSVDKDTHSIRVEAIIENPDEKLLPGMFATLKVKYGNSEKYLTIPQTAVSYNPYGNLVYVITEQSNENKKDKQTPTYIVKQRFVTIGEMRGDDLVVLDGLKEGDFIVTSGQLKLKNNDHVVIKDMDKKSLPSNKDNKKHVNKES